jgi:hypothetical protein
VRVVSFALRFEKQCMSECQGRTLVSMQLLLLCFVYMCMVVGDRVPVHLSPYYEILAAAQNVLC